MTAATLKRITIGLLVGTAVVWIVWDVVLGASHADTESQIIAAWARTVNALPFTLGALVAHWCWQSKDPHYNWWPIAVALLAAVLVWDGLCYPWSVKGATYALVKPYPLTRDPGVWLVLGLPVGHFFWPQRQPDA